MIFTFACTQVLKKETALAVPQVADRIEVEMKDDVKDMLERHPWLKKCLAEGAVKVGRERREELVGGQDIVRIAQMCMQNKLFYRC
jgi:hypothetical protein